MAAYLIGLDIGTSSTKAVVVDRAGNLLAKAAREYGMDAPQAGWAEQDPAVWLAAAVNCVAEALRQSGVEPGEVRALGLTGQMHSLVAADASGEPLRPAIVWADQRSGAQVKHLTAQIGKAHLAEWTGNPLAAGFMLASWAWLRENEPRLAERTRLLLLPKDWVRLRLTGQSGSEPSDASSTLLFDPHIRQWSAPVLQAAGIDPGWMPPVQPSAAEAGGLLPEIARAMGLKAGTPVVFGCSDVTAQALAQGVVEPGQVSVTVGTGGQLFAPLRRPLHDPELRVHLFCHALPDRWHHEAAVLSAGLALRWLRDQVWKGSRYGELADLAAGVEAGLDGLFFLPFLAGERTPYMDPGLRASFVGLGLRHGQAHLVRAAMEGVIFALRQGLDLLESLSPEGARAADSPLIASGGSSAHPLWLQLQADIFNRPLQVDEAPEATARGAALLAGLGAGVYARVEDGLRRSSEPRLVQPDPQRAGLYEAAYQDWLAWANLSVMYPSFRKWEKNNGWWSLRTEGRERS